MSETENRLARLVHRIQRAVAATPAEDHLMTTPDGADWTEASLSRDQLDEVLRKGSVHRHHGES